jgi:hypothetical protein
MQTKRPLALALMFVLTALVAGASGAGGGTAAPARKSPRLQSFGSCGALLAYVKTNATPLVGPYGLGGGLVKGMPVGAPTAARAADDGAGSGSDFSSTNVQEQGVDEPDIVKSNGSHIFTVRGDRIYVVDSRASRPRLVDTLQLEQGWSHELLLHGTTVLVISRGGMHVEPLPGAVRTFAPIAPSQMLLTEVDASDPSRLRVVRTLSVDADYLSARLVGGTVRVVTTTSMPRQLNFKPPAGADTQSAAAATKRNRAVIASSRVSSWLPTYVVRNRRTGAKRQRSLVQCRNVERTPDFSGLGLLTVLTIDLDKGLMPVDSDAVLSDGRIVYASPESLYVATERWADRPLPERPQVVPDVVRTALHAFDISDPSRTTYRASGEVPGFLLSQWSLSEFGGVLRVATTETPPWFGPQAAGESESFVTTLEAQAGKLVTLGRVGGLGRGQRIYAVRFAGDVAYLVTFKQVDPLYTLDLSNPRQPNVLGELEIEGYSAYLHPIGDDLLLGLGQDATSDGRISGTQLSLFDVTNLRRPARLQHWTIGPSSSEAEYDHHAFLYWAATGLVVVPVYSQSADKPFAGAIALRVSRGGITEIGRVSHPASPGSGSNIGAPIRRSLVVGDKLFTVSDAGVKASSLGSLADAGWVAFANS